MHPRELHKLRDDGKFIELSRGVFRQGDAPPATWPDLLAVKHRTPVAVTCCVSAAMVHDQSDELPGKVQIAVPRGVRPPQIRYPPTQVMRLDAATFELGLTSLEVAPGQNVRVYDPTRKVVDLIRLRHHLAEATAYRALRRYLRTRGADVACMP